MQEKFQHGRRLPAAFNRKITMMPGPFSSDHPSNRFFSLPARRGTDGVGLTSEIPEVCARLQTALNELIAAETQLSESLSDPTATDDSCVLNRVRVVRLQCDIAAEDVFKFQPQTSVEKIIKREVVAVYLAIADLDQLELFAMSGPNLLSQCGDDLPVVPLSSTRPRSFLWTTRLRIGLPSFKSSRI